MGLQVGGQVSERLTIYNSVGAKGTRAAAKSSRGSAVITMGSDWAGLARRGGGGTVFVRVRTRWTWQAEIGSVTETRLVCPRVTCLRGRASGRGREQRSMRLTDRGRSSPPTPYEGTVPLADSKGGHFLAPPSRMSLPNRLWTVLRAPFPPHRGIMNHSLETSEINAGASRGEMLQANDETHWAF